MGNENYGNEMLNRQLGTKEERARQKEAAKKAYERGEGAAMPKGGSLGVDSRAFAQCRLSRKGK